MRSLTAGMQTAVAAQTGAFCHLIQIDTSGGTTRITTADQDIDWDSETWTGVGGTAGFGGVQESADAGSQGVELSLSGVDQSLISLILNNSFRGREVNIWHVRVADDGTIISDPIQLGPFLQLADWRIRETVRREGSTCDVTTRVVSALARLQNPIAVRTNTVSHNDMLKRAGLATADTFFQHVPKIGKEQFVRWGPFDIGRRGTAKRRGT